MGLSNLQQALLLAMHSSNDGKDAFVEGVIVSFEGALVVSALKSSLLALLERHETLRSVLGADGQSIEVARIASLASVFSESALRDESIALTQLERAAMSAPFDLQRGPLIRFELVRVSPTRHHLIVTAHRLIADAESLLTLTRELSVLYTANIRNSTPSLPSVAANSEARNASDSTAHQAYWVERLRDASLPPELPVDRVLPAHRSFAAAHVIHELSSEATEAIRTLAAAEDTDAATISQSGLVALVHRLTSSRDVIIGSVSTKSGHVGPHQTILPLRAAPAPQKAFSALVREVAAALQAAREHDDVALESLLPALRIQRDERRPALFAIVCSFECEPSLDFGTPEVRVQVRGLNPTAHAYDWSLKFVDRGDRLSVLSTHNPDLFGEGLIKARLSELETLLVAAAADPTRSLISLPLLSQAAYDTVVTGWNATKRDYDLEKPLTHWLAQAADQYSDLPALISEKGTWSYHEFNTRANALAEELRRLGVGRDRIVGVCAKRSAEMVLALHAIVKAGGAYLPLDPDYPIERLELMVEDAECPVILTSPGLPAATTEWLSKVRPPVLALDASGPVPAVSNEPAPVVEPDSLAYVIFTSGSTGRPKGALLEHRGIVNRILWMQEEYQIGPGDRVLQKTPYSFDVSVWEFFWPLMTGATLVMARPEGHKDPMYLVDIMSSLRITVCHFVPSMLGVFLDYPGSSKCTSLRHVFASGEALAYVQTQRFHQRLPAARLHNLYGPTEASVDVSYWECPPEESRKLVPIGRPVANTQLLVLDEEGEPLPVAVPGELYLGGVQLARGYLKRPDLTAERFVQHPKFGRLYRTGDLSRWLADGTVDFMGRLDSQIKLRGLRIELGEIETQLMALPQISEAVCGVRERSPGDVWLVAWVTARPGEQIDVAAARAELGKHLPDYMIPQLIHTVAAFERLTSGKIDRKVLPDPFKGLAPSLTSVAKPAAAAVHAARPEGAGISLEEEITGRWSELLGTSAIDSDALFFELGGSSIQAIRFVGKLAADLDVSIPMAEFFDAPTVAKFCRYLRKNFPAAVEKLTGRTVERISDQPRDAKRRVVREQAHAPIAVIGMACRVPGANDVESFWNNILGGVDSLHRYTPEELRAAGVSEEIIANPAYVPISGWIPESDAFDHAFFNYTPREAASTDPQQRMLLECAWSALEHAGITARSVDGQIGVFTGLAANSYLTRNLASHAEFRDYGMDYATLGNEKDYSATRIAFKLNLHGPAIGIQTACSSSGTAIHLACQALKAGDCDAAIAGGAAAPWRYQFGHEYVEDGPLTRDGAVRSFDSSASGMVLSAGAACVVLKRLDDAVRDGDTIYAVIHASGLNNDGSDKVAFTAPSVQSQADVIRRALDRSGFEADSIGYVEAHGTATPLGDPIEVAALTRAYREDTQRTSYCALGSVKSNIGHLDAAAACTALIKTSLMLSEARLPKQPYFTQPNPQCLLETTPFYVNRETKEWVSEQPLRAGVSSFGFGGTNFHAVLEQPPRRASTPSARAWHTIRLSAKTDKSLKQQAANIAAWVERHPETNLADVAWTLDTGRVRFEKRGVLVGQAKLDAGTLLEGSPFTSNPSLVWMFPGQGAQHPGMARRLFETESVFRQNMQYCAEILREKLGLDLCELIYGGSPEAAERLRATQLAQPAIFAVSYSCAQLWKSWGFAPLAMIGHSVGEYVAATLAGVFSLEDALTLLAERARLMQHMEPGGMMAVRLSEADLQSWLGDGVELAAINGTQLCVVSGPHPALEALRERLAAKEIGFTVLHTSHAFHSAMMEPAVEVFAAEVAKRARHAPNMPFISSLTGTWITAEQACDPKYWSAQLRHTVRFAPGVQELLQTRGRVLLEVGPGQNLTSSARQLIAPANAAVAIATLPHAQNASADDSEHIAQALGRLWIAGLEVDRELFYAGERRVRVGLPTYPFQRVRHWIAPAAGFEASRAVATLAGEESADVSIEPEVALTPEEQLRRFVRDIIRDQTGITIAEGEFGKTFLDLGFDSLVLTQVTQKLKHALKCQLRFRQLLEELATLNALSAYLHSDVRPEVIEEVVLAKSASVAKAKATTPVVVVHVTQPVEDVPVTEDAQAFDLEKCTLRQRDSIQQLARRRAARSPTSSRVLHGAESSKASASVLDERTLVARSEGAFVWDLDGNRYIDVLPEHGASVMGHSVLSSETDERRSSQPSAHLIGELKADLAKLTGFERVCVYPAASDALAAAVRVARRASGKELIAVIGGRSHAGHDVALGGAAKLTLAFGAEATLQTLAAHASTLAGIVIDPVQLGVEPRSVKSFIEQCRAIASQTKCLLIIDETFASFRIAQGSAQAFLGIKGDLAVYAGAMAEGLPFAIVAGDVAIIDAHHQDTPTALHSLVLTRAHAMLRSFGDSAGARTALESRAGRFVDKLNRIFRAVRAPLRAQRFSSLYSVVVTQREPFAHLFHSYVRERGLTSHHDSLAMLTTAHTDEIMDEMLSLYRDAAAAMRREGLLGRVDAPVQVGVDENVERTDWYLPPSEGAKLGYDSAGNPVWFAAQSGDAVQVLE